MRADGWSDAKLRELVVAGGLQTGPFGGQLHADEYVADGVPVVMPQDIISGEISTEHIARVSEEKAASLAQHRLRTGDLVFARRGDIGRVGIARDRENGWLCGTGCLRARPSERVSPVYLHYAVRRASSIAWLNIHAVGQTMLNLNTSILGQLPADVPPLPEQRAIAAVLDTIDDAIQKTEQIIAKLQQVKQGLLHDLLTRGIDDNGELRDPERHPEQFQDSPLGRIPKGWRAESLGSLVTSAVDGPFGSALKSEHYVPQPGVRLVRLQNIGSGEFIDHDHAWISQRYAETLRRHDAVSGDVLVASLGDENHPYGRACVFQDGSWAIVKADCFRLRPTGFMNSDFLAASLNIDVYHRPLRGLAQGVTRDRVNLGNLLRVRLPVPSREEQNSIINMVDSLQRRITCEQNRAQKLRSTKAGLSEDLLTGRVRTTSLPGFSA